MMDSDVICFVFFFNFFLFVKNGQTSLHVAASQGFEEIVKILIERGSDVDLQKKQVFIFFLFVVEYLVVCYDVSHLKNYGFYYWLCGGGGGYVWLVLFFFLFFFKLLLF